MTDADVNRQTEGGITQITITEVKGQHGQWHTYNTFDHVQKPQIENQHLKQPFQHLAFVAFVQRPATTKRYF